MNQKKIKVLVDGEALVVDHFSGVGHYTADLLIALDKLASRNRGLSLEICAPYRRVGRLGRFGFKNFKIRKLPFPTRISNAMKIRGAQPPIDLIFGKRLFIYPNYSSWPALFSKSMPIVYDLSFVKYPEFVEPRNQKFLVEQVRKSVKRASKVITISQNSKNEIVEEYGLNPNDVVIAYPAINPRKFYRRSEEEIKKIKAKYGIFDDYILFVGNIEPRKNLKTLIRAYEKLDESLRRKYSLLLIGAKGWLDSDIHDLLINSRMNGNKIVLPADYVTDKDLPAIYSGAQAFVYVSIYEGFGIPLLEAMGCGVPVICSNNSSLPEVAGSAAVMVDAHSEEEIAEAITKVLSDTKLSRKLVHEGKQQVKKFSYEKSAETLLEAIKTIAG